MHTESPLLTRRELLHTKLDALLDECDLIPSNPHTLDTMERGRGLPTVTISL